jgi:small-conductance mechanosensitive channel
MKAILETYVETVPWLTVATLALTVLLGYLAARTLSYLIGRQIDRQMDETSGLVARKLVFYGIIAGLVVVLLGQLNMSLGTLLAAGGLLGVALGFASQTAVSNIISGLFLIFERPFQVSDVIRVDGQFGLVESIDLLSTKIRTFDNLSWRMPNEKLLKSDIYNITKYDIRRQELKTSISYGDDIEVAREVILKTAEEHPLVLAQPEPMVLVNSMGDSGIELLLRFWFERPDFLTVTSQMNRTVKEALEEAGCTIPFPHRTVYTRSEEEWVEQEELHRQRQEEFIAESNED